MEGLQWIFTPADAPWQNGVTKALIRSVKRAIEFSVGENALTISLNCKHFFSRLPTC